MGTYQLVHGGKEYQMDYVIRRVVLAGLLLFVVLALGGCKKPEGTQDITPTAVAGQPTKALTPEPTKAQPENTTEPTKEPEVTPEATKTPLPTQAPLRESSFPVVTPVPKEKIADIKGKFTKDTFPTVDGSTATIPLSEALYRYATGADAEEASQAITHTKTTNSYKRLYAGEVDLLIVYEPAEEIVERMKTEPLLIKPIGLDALVFMANAANPVESLTMEQLVSIYSGNITNWAEVGGKEKKLLAFQRPVGSGSQTLMQKLVMGDAAMTDGENVFRYSTMSDILEGMLSYTGEDNTLGYSVFYYANNMYYFPELKFMGVDGVLPSTQTIYDGSYQLTNAFYAVIRPDEPENSAAHQMFDWLTGEEGQKMILELGYVPVAMPEGGELVTERSPENTSIEVTAHASLSEGEHYVFFASQNAEVEYLYGDVTVYDKDWNACARFYNVVLPNQVCGLYNKRYLPIGQIRQNDEGTQQVFYGIYDLEKKEYSVTPQFQDLILLDKEKGYYAVVEQGGRYDEYFIINGAGEHLLEGLHMEDWLTISKRGNGYLDYQWNYDGYNATQTVYFYDDALRLRKVYYDRKEEVPSQEDRLMGVEYYYVGEHGCLVDENGEMRINEEMFLRWYGNGTDTECILPFYSLVMEEEGTKTYAVEYAGEIYLVDSDLSLIATVPKKSLPNVWQVEYCRDFYYGYDYVSGETRYYSYDDAELTMQDGTLIDGIYMMWENENYLLYKEYTDKLVVEEHIPAKNQVYRYEYPLSKDTVNKTEIQYIGDGYILLSDWTGKSVPSPYQIEGEELEPVALNRFTLYHGGDKIVEQEGIWAYVQEMSDGNLLFSVNSEESIRLETESLFEMPYFIQNLSRYFVIAEDGILFAQETPAYLQVQSDGFLQFGIGSYTYVFDYDGNQYVKALNHMLGTD
ncbi:MAG: substrate-binding domain-containing protein [Lachnospiraceae bacterium]